MKIALILLALGAGALVTGVLFVIVVTADNCDENALVCSRDIVLLIPIGIAVAASFVLSKTDPGRWKWVALCVVAPTLFMSVLFAIAGDHLDWHWLALAVIALAVCAGPAWLAHVIKGD
jgi:hypothetical protein